METPTPPQTTGSEREMVRPRDDRILAGVAAGLGNRFDINPWWFRAGFIVLAPFGGLGVLLYITGWLLMPDEGEDRSLAAQWIGRLDTSDAATVVGVVLIGVALVILAASLRLFSGQLVFAAVLFIVGIVLFRGDIGRRSSGDGGAEPGHTDEPAVESPQTHDADAVVTVVVDDDAIPEAVQQTVPAATPASPVESEPVVSDTDASVGTATEAAVTAPAPPPPRPRSFLGTLTMAFLLISLGGLALADIAGWLYPEAWHYVAVTVGVVGIGLLVGTLFGRARWLIVVGLVLTPLLLVTATAAAVFPSWSISGDFGDREFHPDTVSDLPVTYELAAGSLLVDLSGLDSNDLAETSRDLEISVGAGEVIVLLPRDMVGTVEARVGIGRIAANDRERAGIAPRETIRFPDSAGDADGGLQLSVSVGVGNTEIYDFEGRN
jgi:phage shock protein PspC (stress-responsive transcriptional regulator)